MDRTEAEDTKKRWQEYTEELYKKDLNDPDNHHSVITHWEPDILKCELKWALRSITTMNIGVHMSLSDLVSLVCMPRSGEDMWTQGLFISMYDRIHYK